MLVLHNYLSIYLSNYVSIYLCISNNSYPSILGLESGSEMLGLDEDNTYKENSRIELTEKDVDEGVDDSLSHLLPLI